MNTVMLPSPELKYGLSAICKWSTPQPTSLLLPLLLSRFRRVRLLCDPIDGSPPGSPVPGILQARILEWVTISFSNAWKWKVKVKSFSHVRLLETPCTAAYQAPPSMGFSRQEHWSGVPLPSPTSLARSNSMTLVFIILSSGECHITLTFAEWLFTSQVFTSSKPAT